MPRILRHDVVDSTNERAFAALADGSARDGDVHVALEQTAGRGRLGRKWKSPSGEGLYASYVHVPDGPAPPAALLTMAAGLAVWDAVRELGIGSVELEWPNDVMADGGKLAGILVEARGQDPRRPGFVVGIGMNVLQKSFPAELTKERRVTSLALAGCGADPDGVLDRLLPHLGRRLGAARIDPGAICEDYLAATGLAGGEVRVRCAGEEHRGRLEGFEPEGRARLRAGDGETVRLELAHVSAVEPLPPSL